MTLEEILQEKESRLQSVPDELATKAELVQKDLIKQLIRQLDSLEREDGKIKISTRNIAKIQTIAEDLSKFLFDKTEYSLALKSFAGEFNIQAALSGDYLKLIQGDFQDKEIYKANLQLSQKLTIELLTKSGINQALINPLKEILQSSVTSGSSFGDAISTLTDFIIGTKVKDGTLLSHIKQIAYDGFAFSDRNYLKLVTQDLGYEFYQYFGGLLKDSRCFCVQRAGKIFHTREIEYWGETPSLWDKKAGCSHGGGMVLETTSSTIWTYAGGYNCQHSIVPVAYSSVPKQVIDRAKSAGYIS